MEDAVKAASTTVPPLPGDRFRAAILLDQPATPALAAHVTAALAARLPGARTDDATALREGAQARHTLHVRLATQDELDDGEITEGAVALEARGEPYGRETIGEALRQCWDWPEAGEVIAGHAGALTIEEASDPPVPAPARLALVHESLRAVLALLRDWVRPGVAGGEEAPVVAPRPVALYFGSSDRLIDPTHYEQVIAGGDGVYGGGVNVRLVGVEGGRPNEQIMDTRGLPAFDAPDLQVHFVGLEPNAVADLLYNYAHYMLEKGDVIADGHTIQGTEADTRWTVRREPALLEPLRPVLNFHPGEASAI